MQFMLHRYVHVNIHLNYIQTNEYLIVRYSSNTLPYPRAERALGGLNTFKLNYKLHLHTVHIHVHVHVMCEQYLRVLIV